MKQFLVLVMCVVLRLTQGAPSDLSELEAVLNSHTNPVIFQLESPVTPFIGREAELDEIKGYHANHEYVVLIGKRGIGKTELAKKYAERYMVEDPANVLWINCTSITNMVEDMEKLYKQILGSLDPIKTRVEMVREIFNYFKPRKSLFVLDGADEGNVFIKNLKVVVGPQKGKLDFLITSRSEEFNNLEFSVVKVPEFTKAEAVKYLKIVLKDLDIDTSESNCEKLSEKVEYLPLALKAMTEVIIKENKEGKHTTIEDIIRRLGGDITTTTVVYVQGPKDKEIERDVLEKIQLESKKIGTKIATGAEKAWDKISDGASYVGSQISYGAKEAGKEFVKAGESVKNWFKGLG